MKYFNKYIFFILILFLIISCNSNKITSNYSMYEKIENYEEDENNQYDFENKIYKSSIHTVLLHPYGFELGEAILNLNKKDSLLLSFDELDSLPKNYFYTLIHCNSDWTKSNLLETEYLKGFGQELIFEYTNSFNTIQNYVNYKATIPSKNMIPILSGNYLLIVFEENKKDRPILSKQIMILNEKINIEANIKRATILDKRNYQHEIDFTIKHNGYNINDPFNNLYTVIKQNNRSDNSIVNLTPVFIKKNEIIYDYEEENLFDGGNEYRFFDCSSLRYMTERIKDINISSDSNKIFLFQDKSRNFQRYSSLIKDINGKKIIRTQDGLDFYSESDYVLIHFTLPYSHKITHGELYIHGEISDYGFPDTHKLNYNEELGVYEAEIYLKQGYYNYEYILLKNNGKTSSAFIEGSHFETINDYTIYIYHKEIGEEYDQLIGIKKISSKGLF